MDRLIEGYHRFRAEVWPTQRARYKSLATKGQSPHTFVVACSNSRVDPQTVFGAAPGELFVVRNIAGLVPPYQPDAGYHGTSAALEFAVRVLKVPRLVVLGHVQCGGVQAMVEGAPAEARDFVEPWMSMARSVMHQAPHAHGADVLDRCEIEVVRLSLANMLTFPWIAEAVDEGRLTLAGFRFEIRSGILARLHGAEMVPVG